MYSVLLFNVKNRDYFVIFSCCANRFLFRRNSFIWRFAVERMSTFEDMKWINKLQNVFEIVRKVNEQKI